MNRFALCIVSLSFFTQAFAQNESYLHNRYILERMATQGTVANGVPIGTFLGPPPGVIGDVYLHHDYRNAGFILYDNEKVLSRFFPARLDLQRNQFNLLTPSGEKVLSGNLVKSMLWRDSATNSPQYFVNAKDFKTNDDVPYLGFFEVLSEGQLSLFKKSEVIFKPAEQQVKAHSVGSKDDKFIKKSKLYYASGNTVLELPGRKDLLKLFHEKQAEVTEFIETNEINFKRENHLQALFDYYNSLVKK